MFLRRSGYCTGVLVHNYMGLNMMKREKKPADIEADTSTRGVIDDFRHRMQSLYFLAESQIPHVREAQANSLKELAESMELIAASLKDHGANAKERAHAVSRIFDSVSQLTGHLAVKHDEMLAKTIFISVFSIFDAYLNHLLRNLYDRKPNLIHLLEKREITLADLLNSTREKIIESLIDDDIESLLRKSYSDIFTKLASRFDVTLTAFPNWQVFIECSQRRNLVTHCDGVVSDQYCEKCREIGCKLDPDLVPGKTKLGVTIEYLLNCIDVVTEVGIKLGQILWRKTSEHSIEAADSHLADTIFDALKREKWQFALRLSELTDDLAKLKNQHLREAKIAKILLINHAQAAKWIGNMPLAKRILGSVDWSDGLLEFQLAVAVLNEDYDNAAAMMEKLGPDSELCPAHGYVGWPVFREFRLTPQFAAAFRSIFGVEFADEVKKVSDEEVKKISDQEASEPIIGEIENASRSDS